MSEINGVANLPPFEERGGSSDGCISVTRVPGGAIYRTYYTVLGEYRHNSMFVPISEILNDII